MSRDMMGAFELYQPDSVDGAVELLEKFGKELGPGPFRVPKMWSC